MEMSEYDETRATASSRAPICAFMDVTIEVFASAGGG